MKFELIDLSTWARREHFEHYLEKVPCTYSMTLNLDITALFQAIKKRGVKLFPTSLYLLSTVVNKHEEFRMAIDEKGRVGIFDCVHPLYTFFHPDSETFSDLWTEYSDSFSEFYSRYLKDVETYGHLTSFSAKPKVPDNLFTVSSIPWVSFTGFNLNLPKIGNYLRPIFTTEKFFEQNDRLWLPLSIQVHHAVCDGYHVARLVHDLQSLTHQFAGEL